MTFLSTELIRVSARCTFGVAGDDLVNVMYFQLVSPSSLTDAQVLADIGEVLELIYAPIPVLQNVVIQYVDYTVKNETLDAAPLTASWPTFTVGGAAPELLPRQCVALVLGRTAKSRKQGRVNLGGMTEASANGSSWLAAFLTSTGVFAANLLLLHVATNGNYRYGVASAGVTPPRTIANSFDLPISSTVVGLVRTQRRRSPGFGS